MFLSIIIPCYNEESRIGKTLDAIFKYLQGKDYSSEIIVVDNGSEDRTIDVVQGYMNSIPNLRILNKKNYGKGWAVKQGMLAANGEYRLFTDADNSTDISELEKLLPIAIHGGDVVISSRKVSGSVIVEKQPLYRIWLGNIFTWFVKIVMPIGDIKDTQNGFKLFSRRAAERIFPLQSIYYWAFDVEVLALARIFGFKIIEVPIEWRNDERSKMKLMGMVRMAFEVILARFHISKIKKRAS